MFSLCYFKLAEEIWHSCTQSLPFFSEELSSCFVEIYLGRQVSPCPHSPEKAEKIKGDNFTEVWCGMKTTIKQSHLAKACWPIFSHLKFFNMVSLPVLPFPFFLLCEKLADESRSSPQYMLRIFFHVNLLASFLKISKPVSFEREHATSRK